METPDISPIVQEAIDKHSYISLTDFNELQNRLKILFPESKLEYSVVSTYIDHWRETGIEIRITNKQLRAYFSFSIFHLRVKKYSPKYHLIRYQFNSRGLVENDRWLSLAEDSTLKSSFNFTVAHDAIQAYINAQF